MNTESTYDCIIIGAGPGGLQAAIYLGRFNRKVLLLDRGGGRTHHAKHIENFLSHRAISGRELIETGIEQARSFHVQVVRSMVTRVAKPGMFEIYAGEERYHSKSVIVSSGVYDNVPPIENTRKFLGISFFTCIDCDGYRTSGKKLVVVGNSFSTVRLCMAMQEMYTRDITLVLYFYDPPPDVKEQLRKDGIILVRGRPQHIIGDEVMEGLQMEDGRRLECEAIMSSFGFKMNDSFLSELSLERDSRDFKYVTSRDFESSLPGLYIVGPLNTGNDQAIIAAGEGAVAAININRNLLHI